jgi:subtilisin family serine protease
MRDNNLVLRLPTIEPEMVLQTMSETYDWGLIDLNIPAIHKQTMGENVKIAIVDSGKSNHFEVEPAMAGSCNFTTSPADEDRHGHSTFISGLIAAQQNNEGVIGIAPKSKIYFAKAIDDGGRGDPSCIVQAIRWCMEQQVDIISISAGMFVDFKPIHDVIQQAFEKNIIVLAAAGNTGTRYYDIAFPARYPEVIGVAAYDHNRQPATFSSRGVNVKFAMPGVDVYSTYLNNSFAKMNGTSFACPILAGVCALILSKHRTNPSLTPCCNTIQMLEHLKKYAINLGDPNAVGFGSVNVEGVINY